jgi:hypothetical protein
MKFGGRERSGLSMKKASPAKESCKVMRSVVIALVLLSLLLTACATKLAVPAPVAAKSSSVAQLKAAGLELSETAEKLSELQYNLFGQGKGWLAIDTRIFLTADNGKTWDEVSARVPENYMLGRVHFFDENQAWALYLGGEGADLRFRLYTTSDAGKTWNELSEAINPILTGQDLIPDGKVFIRRLSPLVGYLLVKSSTGANFSTGILLKTSDGGGTWAKISAPAGEDFIFADEAHGFMLKSPQYDSLYTTNDAGQTWTELADLPQTDGAESYRVGLPEFHADGYGVYSVFAYKGETLLRTSIMQSNNYGQSWSLGAEDLSQVDQTPGSEPFLQLLPDGNLSRWSRIPSGGGAMSEAGVQSNQEAQIINLSAYGTSDAWGTFISGFCNAQLVVGQEQLHCSQDQLLGLTTDGGKTWQPLPLPIAISKSSKSVFTRAPEPKGPLPVGNLEGPQIKAINPTVKVAVGHGFDQCEIPGNASLDAWRDSSPYNVVNLYIGGSARGCSNRALTYSKVSYMYNNGWTFIPTWVGPQSPCTDFRSRMSSNPTAAYQEGVENANQAMAKMFELGLTDANGHGGVVYYDLEYYVGDNACQTAVRSFFEGWNGRLHQLGALSGAYGASCHYWSTNQPPQNLSNLAGLTNSLDAVWIAKYIATPYYYNPTVSVWGIASCFPDTLWSQNQRLRQYTGGHDETWGGYTINIDSNVLQGPVTFPAIGDTLAPQTNLSFSGTVGESGYYKSTGSITLTAMDRQSGVKATYYQLNGGAITAYTASFALTDNRDYTIAYYSVDWAGNREATKTAIISVDSIPPTTSVQLQGQLSSVASWFISPVTVNIQAADNFSGVAVSQQNFNGGAWTDLPAGNSATISTNGADMTLGIRSKDKAGNYNAPVYNQLSIDTELPVNPSFVDPHCLAMNGVTQGLCNDPDFTWHGAYDSGSGLKLYEYYWGQDPNGTGPSLQQFANDNHFDPGPVNDGSVTYLRMRVQDNLDGWSAWQTVYTLRFSSSYTNFLFLPAINK